MVLRCLLEGNSVNPTERITGIDQETILDLLVLVDARCQRFRAEFLRGIEVKDVQAAEIWAFVGCKQKTAERLHKGKEFGDAYCFTSIERSTNLIIAWHLGKRSSEDTNTFCSNLAAATTGRFQLTTDGYSPHA